MCFIDLRYSDVIDCILSVCTFSLTVLIHFVHRKLHMFCLVVLVHVKIYAYLCNVILVLCLMAIPVLTTT